MKDIKHSQKIVLFDIDYTLFDTAAFKASNLTNFMVYDEVIAVITRLQKVAKLGIFSEGETTLQTKKLAKTKIDKFFHKEHIHIMKKKSDVIAYIVSELTKTDQLYLVDDKLTILQLAKKLHPSIITIWIKRGEYAMRQQPIHDFEPDATVLNLQNIIPLIEK